VEENGLRLGRKPSMVSRRGEPRKWKMSEVSGFIVPNITKHMVRDVPAATQQWQIVIDGIFQINQAFAPIYSVAASIAIILWSVSALRNGGFGRGGAVYGCIISTLLIVGIGVGRLHLDIHGMMVIWLAQAIGFITVGFQLWSQPAGGSPPQ
jgi:hypothetical protein